MAARSSVQGVLSTIVAMGSFVGCDTCMKLAMADLPPFEVLALRGIAATLWLAPIVLFAGLAPTLRKGLHPWVLARSASETVAVLFFVLCLKHMPLGDLTALVQMAPLFILLIGRVAWGDRVGLFGYALVVLGLVGATLVAQPGADGASPFAPLALIVAALAAGRDALSRKAPADAPTLVVALVIIVMVMLAACVASALFETWAPPEGRHLGLAAAAGLFLVGGQTFIFRGFRLAGPALAAPFLYTGTAWALLSGAFVFGDRPNVVALLGVGLIVVCGLAAAARGLRQSAPVRAVAGAPSSA